MNLLRPIKTDFAKESIAAAPTNRFCLWAISGVEDPAFASPRIRRLCLSTKRRFCLCTKRRLCLHETMLANKGCHSERPTGVEESAAALCFDWLPPERRNYFVQQTRTAKTKRSHCKGSPKSLSIPPRETFSQPSHSTTKKLPRLLQAIMPSRRTMNLVRRDI